MAVQCAWLRCSSSLAHPRRESPQLRTGAESSAGRPPLAGKLERRTRELRRNVGRVRTRLCSRVRRCHCYVVVLRLSVASAQATARRAFVYMTLARYGRTRPSVRPSVQRRPARACDMQCTTANAFLPTFPWRPPRANRRDVVRAQLASSSAFQSPSSFFAGHGERYTPQEIFGALESVRAVE